ncbi:MAG: hypothetical protein KGI38_01935 [Thaumarchaeota archaeon]|nr:hypothetical protein [Nitrososphaerota archaeon]
MAKPKVVFSETAFAAHKAKIHLEDYNAVLSDIRNSNSGKNRALTCDRCWSVILMRPKTLGILEDPTHTVKRITTKGENIRFLLLHELVHVKLKDSDFRKTGSYHTRRMLLVFNRCANKLGVTPYRE